MEKDAAKQAVKLMLYMQRSNLKPSQRNRPVKQVSWAYPAAAERKYTALLKQWMQPLIDFTEDFITRQGEALVRGDTADTIRADALPGGTFTRMVNSLQGWAAQYVPDNPDGAEDGPSIFMGLGSISDELFEANKKQWDKQCVSGIGVRFPDTADWWEGTKKQWAQTNYTLIKSMTNTHITLVNNLAEQAAVNGWSVKMLSAEIHKLNNKLSDSKVKLIARDQIGKLNGMATQARMQSIGLDLYTWSTSGDERVRTSHELIDKKLCKWGDATVYSEDGGKTWKPRPEGAVLLHPGMDIQCRCVALAYFQEIVNEADEEITAKKNTVNELSDKPVQPEQTAPNPAAAVIKALPFLLFENSKGEKIQKQYDKHLEMSENWVQSLTKDENNAMIRYTDIEYKDINRLLLGNTLNEPDRKAEFEQYIKNFDAALKKYPLDENIVIYRGDRPHHYSEWQVGGTYTVNCYQSGAVFKNKAWSGKGMTITIRVPKGTPGAYIDGHGEHKTEEEYVLARGLKYKVLKKTAKTMEAEVIP